MAGADAQKRQPVPMTGVEIGLYLENEAGNTSLVGSIKPCAVSRKTGGGARSRMASRNGSTPKLFNALQKNTGVISPAR